MRFLIADTFTSSLVKLTNEEQSLVKNAAFDLQINPSRPGLQFHRVERAKDKRFWSVRSGRDLRIIVHKTESDFLLCYVDHHDAAYTWAERRKLQTHPTTGAAQLVEIQETIRIVPKYAEKFEQKVVSKPFERLTNSQLLQYGVPTELLDEIRIATEDTVLDLFTNIPAEAAEALLELATGGRREFTDKEHVAMLPSYPDANLACVAESVTPYNPDPFDHPDAKRRFALITSSDELSRALEFPWDKWTVFLHPEQRSFVEKHFNGPARVSGSAGTGKTIVALHRAFNLALKNPDGRVLLATFSDALAQSLQVNLNKLITSQPRLGEQIEVLAIPTLIKRLFEAYFGKASFASDADIRQIIESEKSQADTKKFSLHFLLKEWEQIVDAWQIRTWDEYRLVPRLGRKTRLNEDGRKILWNLFVNVRKVLSIKGLITESEACQRLEDRFRKDSKSPFDFAVIDEAQDISVPQLRLLSAILAAKPNGLFFAGDLGQRIFQQPFSWAALGVDVRGRSKTLRINYRTSQEIRRQADRLLDSQFTDVDGVIEDRSGIVSVFSGPAPAVRRSATISDECNEVAKWLREQLANGITEKEMCIIVRTENEIHRAIDVTSRAGIRFRKMDDASAKEQNVISIATMHFAKGLEFRAVVVMACDDEVIPLQSRIESVGDDGDLQEVYATERQLLYVACTRARDSLLVSGVVPASEFLDDFEQK